MTDLLFSYIQKLKCYFSGESITQKHSQVSLGIFAHPYPVSLDTMNAKLV